MHSLPDRLHSLVYLPSSGANPTEKGPMVTCGKVRKTGGFHPLSPSNEKDKGGSLVQRLFRRSSRAVHTLLARFTRHILRPLRSYVFTFTIVTEVLRGLLLRDNSSTDTGISGLCSGLRAESSPPPTPFLSLSFTRISLRSSLNPRYPRAD